MGNTKDEAVEQTSLKINEKLTLSLKEASEYSGIGINTIYRMVGNPNCSFVIKIGKTRRVKREAFEEYIKNTEIIDD